ncbi:MAG: metallopeptidase family protein, partial [Vicinamibacteria bacterium]
EEAETVCARALALEEPSELRQLEALLRLQRAESEEAATSARRAIELDPDSAEGHYTLGLAYTQLGRISDADAAFARAAELDPDSYFQPSRLSEEDFEEAVDEALSRIPEEFEPFLTNVEVAVEDVPDPKMVREGLEFDLLGVYQGHTIQTESWDLPDRVLLFQRILENISPDRETLIEEIRDTVFHEVGHHMGMDEDAVRSAEEEWFDDEGG